MSHFSNLSTSLQEDGIDYKQFDEGCPVCGRKMSIINHYPDTKLIYVICPGKQCQLHGGYWRLYQKGEE